jgi:uncharacterized protein YndB with AHSA1/START domain
MASVQSRPDFTLTVRRTFAAPREKVFAAFAEREQLEKWMCADAAAHVVKHHKQDIGPGGRYLIEVRDLAKGVVYWGQGTYLEVTPPTKIRFTWRWTTETPDGKNLHDNPAESEVIVEFFERGPAATEVVLTQLGLGSAKDYKDHEGGWKGCFDVLEKVLRD